MNGFRYALVYEDKVIDASDSLTVIQQVAKDSEFARWQLIINVYRYGEHVGTLAYHPPGGWWNIGQWADMEGAL